MRPDPRNLYDRASAKKKTKEAGLSRSRETATATVPVLIVLLRGGSVVSRGGVQNHEREHQRDRIT
jgi:hypothetical protein